MAELEFPDEKRIAELREEGITPYSSLATSCLLTGIVLSWLLYSYSEIEDFLTSDILSHFKLSFSFVVKVFLMPAVLVSFLPLVFIYLQNKFLLKLNFLSPDLSRLKAQKQITFGSFVFELLKICLVLVVIYGTFYLAIIFLLPILLELLETEPVVWKQFFHLSIKGFLSIGIVVSFGIVFLVYFLNKLLFLFKHRTKKDD